MADLWSALGLVAFLVVLHGALAGSAVALISLREAQLERLERRGGGGILVSKLAREPRRVLIALNLVTTSAGFLAAGVAALTLSDRLARAIDGNGYWVEPIAVVCVCVILAHFGIVLGDLAPKRVARQHAEGWCLAVARFLAALTSAARPGIWLVDRATNVVVRLLGGDPDRERADVTQEELLDLVAQTSFSAAQRTIIEGAVEITDRTLREVLVPRREILMLEADLKSSEGLARMVVAGHSRAPVVAGQDLDDVIGVVHMRDLVFDAGVVGDHAKPPFIAPESMDVVDALRRMQGDRQQLAVVVNEHGAVEGIVTMEDLMEEVVGEIYDEGDPDVQSVVRESDGAFVLPGSFPIHDTADLGADLPEGPYATVAGLVLARLGRIPDGGETVRVDGWSLNVIEVKNRAVTRVRLRPLN